MDWSHATPGRPRLRGRIDRGFDHFGGLNSAAAAELCSLIQTADVSQTWMRDGARTLTDWVSARMKVRHETAHQLVSVARRIEGLPELSARFAVGDLSVDQVDAISRMATAATEHILIEDAIALSNISLDRAARRSDPPSTSDERTVWERRRLVRQWNLDESELRFHGNLPGVEGRLFDEAIDQQVDDMTTNPETGLFDLYETRSADALIGLAATSGDETSSPPQVTVYADLASLKDEGGTAELDNTALVPNQTARRLSCDCVVETVVTNGSVVVGVGRNSRTIPGWLRRLVVHRDGGRCQHPGCRATKWIQVHHIQHWADGGATDLDNLILLCGFHHRFLHEHGWHITGDPNQQVTFRRPDWSPFPGPREKLDPRLQQLLRSI